MGIASVRALSDAEARAFAWFESGFGQSDAPRPNYSQNEGARRVRGAAPHTPRHRIGARKRPSVRSGDIAQPGARLAQAWRAPFLARRVLVHTS